MSVHILTQQTTITKEAIIGVQVKICVSQNSLYIQIHIYQRDYINFGGANTI